MSTHKDNAPDIAVTPEPKLTVPDDEAAALYASTLKAIAYPDRFDVSKIKVDGVDFMADEPAAPEGAPYFSAGA